MDERLKEAYELLKQGHRPSALTLIMQVIQQDRDCADAWFLLAAAREDIEDKRSAVNHALKLNPHHKAALNLQQRLENAASPPAPPPPHPAVPSAVLTEKPANEHPATSSVIVPLSASDTSSSQTGQSAPTILDALEENLVDGRPIAEFNDNDVWRDFWNNPTSTILGIFTIIGAISLPLMEYLKTHDRAPGLAVIILVVCLGVALLRFVLGKTMDGRAILPLSVATLFLWVLLFGNLKIKGDTGNIEHVQLFFTGVYGVLFLGWVTDTMPFGPRLNQAVWAKFDTFVRLKGPIDLGETKQGTILLSNPTTTDVYYFHGQAGDEIWPTVRSNGDSSLRVYMYSWITVFGIWSKLHRLRHLSINSQRLPYTGTYVIAVGLAFHNPERDMDTLKVKPRGSSSYHLEMNGTRHGADAATSISSLAYMLQTIMEDRTLEKIDEMNPEHIVEDLIERN